jgi:hypothetical protein
MHAQGYTLVGQGACRGSGGALDKVNSRSKSGLDKARAFTAALLSVSLTNPSRQLLTAARPITAGCMRGGVQRHPFRRQRWHLRWLRHPPSCRARLHFVRAGHVRLVRGAQ